VNDEAGEAFAIDVLLTLAADTDPRAPGGEVTIALCGHWEHDGSCRWPHNSRVDTDTTPAHLRSVVIATAEDRVEVIRLVEERLRGDVRWSVVEFVTEPVSADERALAERLANST
jgi:hypothetical protein